LELRLAGLKTLATIECDLDRWPFLRPGVPGEPSADRNGDQRDHPNYREAPRPPRHGARDRRPLLGDVTHWLAPLVSQARSLPAPNFALAAARVNPSHSAGTVCPIFRLWLCISGSDGGFTPSKRKN